MKKKIKKMANAVNASKQQAVGMDKKIARSNYKNTGSQKSSGSAPQEEQKKSLLMR
jgi:hypothetical protein